MLQLPTCKISRGPLKAIAQSIVMYILKYIQLIKCKALSQLKAKRVVQFNHKQLVILLQWLYCLAHQLDQTPMHFPCYQLYQHSVNKDFRIKTCTCIVQITDIWLVTCSEICDSDLPSSLSEGGLLIRCLRNVLRSYTSTNNTTNL